MQAAISPQIDFISPTEGPQPNRIGSKSNSSFSAMQLFELPSDIQCHIINSRVRVCSPYFLNFRPGS